MDRIGSRCSAGQVRSGQGRSLLPPTGSSSSSDAMLISNVEARKTGEK